jgi:adenosine deaminase
MLDIDLHRHLEAAVPLDTLPKFISTHGIDLPGELPQLRKILTCTERPGDLGSFLEPFTEYIHKCFASAEAIHDFTKLAIKQLNDEGLQYGELRFSPWYMSGVYSGTVRVSPDEVVKAVISARDEAAKLWPVGVGLILIVGRELDLSCAHKIIDLALEHRDSICGVDLAGHEARFPPELFVDVFLRAREAGIPITIHAGEAGPASNIRTAVEELGATRIGHGIAVTEDPEVLALVRDRGVVLETCPTSNWLTGAVTGSPANHPLMKLHRAGVKVTVNTDDPLLQQSWLSDEVMAARHLGAGDEDIASLKATAYQAAFLNAAQKRLNPTTSEGRLDSLGLSNEAPHDTQDPLRA